ncbi:hypothetical protein F2P79_003715 [Pimephales promelas]|nr:hypothetical protein F2P79_003715 [Pimephales promelas]
MVHEGGAKTKGKQARMHKRRVLRTKKEPSQVFNQLSAIFSHDDSDVNWWPCDFSLSRTHPMRNKTTFSRRLIYLEISSNDSTNLESTMERVELSRDGEKL